MVDIVTNYKDSDGKDLGEKLVDFELAYSIKPEWDPNYSPDGLWLWGINNYGQLGDNTITHKSSPVQTISGGTDWAQIAGGYYHSLAIKTS